MSKKHALLSASGAKRWMTCTPSARLEEHIPQVESPYADEGTLAHEIGEWLIKEAIWGISVQHEIDKLKDNPFYSDEMYEYCWGYAEFVATRLREAPDGAVLIQEQRLALTEFIPEGFGTTDNAIVAPGYCEIIDLKYGKGVPVDSYENPQLMVYALGVLAEYDLLYDIKNVVMTIYQPRIDNTSTYEITANNLYRWGRETLRPAALLAFQGIGDILPGEHCKFCRVRPVCKEHAKYNLALAAREFEPAEITDEQLVKILKRAKAIKNWITSVEQYALRRALEGHKWPGLKVVEGRSVRKYSDQQAVIEAISAAGLPEDDFVIKKLPGITELSKKMSKLDFQKIVEPLLIKPKGSPTLADEDDKRPEWNSSAAAYLDFMSPDEDE